MGSESELVEHELSSGPKLALFSLPSKPSETPGLLSPPPQTTASIPFQWEEAPGKPRPCNTQFKPNSARSLELPPRLLFSGQAKVTNMPSPTTVLDGPYVGQTLSFSSSFRNPADSGKSSGYFGSRRWSSFRKNNKEVVESNFDFSASVFYGSDRIAGGVTKVNIPGDRRRGSFFSFSQTRSHLWASIYESFKQVVPWKSRQEKLRKMGSKKY